MRLYLDCLIIIFVIYFKTFDKIREDYANCMDAGEITESGIGFESKDLHTEKTRIIVCLYVN